MTKRNIMNAIIKDKQCPERMGLFEQYWSDTLAHWESQGYPKNVKPTDYFNYDIDVVNECWFDPSPFPGKNEIVEENDETIVHINGWGTKLRDWKKRSGTPEHLGFDIVNRDVWEKKYKEPLCAFNPSRFKLNDMRVSMKLLREGEKFICYTNLIHFELMRASMGDVVMLESMYLDPEWINDFCTVVTDMFISSYDYLFREVGKPDGMFLYEDMGYTNAPFISPELQREMIFPHHKKLINFFHDNKLPVIMHSCGKIRPFLNTMMDAGVDCLQVLEAKAGQDVREFAAATNNKMAFMGNINIQAIETNDRSIIDAEILPKLHDIKKNRIPFVFHSDHSIPKTVSFETYQYVVDLYRKNCKY